MAKTAIVYNSKYGNTERYAKWLAEETGADLFVMNKGIVQQLDSYDTVIYGGGLYATGILGFKAFSKFIASTDNKKFIVFSVGASPAHKKAIIDIKNNNFTKEIENKTIFFHLRGGFDYSNLSFIDKFLMSMLKLKLQLKKSLTKNEQGMLYSYNKKTDWKDKKALQPIINLIDK